MLQYLLQYHKGPHKKQKVEVSTDGKTNEQTKRGIHTEHGIHTERAITQPSKGRSFGRML